MQSKEWQQKFAEQVGKGIDSARNGKSDQWIADRTKELGHPISRTAISEYRRGIRKSMPVTDLMIIAQALRVPPVTLLFPKLPNGEVTLLSSTVRPISLDSLFWFTGETPWAPTSYKIFADLDDNGSPKPPTPSPMYSTLGASGQAEVMTSKEAQILDLSRELYKAWNDIRAAFGALTRPDDPQASLPSEIREGMYKTALKRVAEISTRLTDLGADMTDWSDPDLNGDD